MSADFWASYLSGALGIAIGNRLDIWKTQLQAGNRHFDSVSVEHNARAIRRFTDLFRGAAAPILGYGALNSILFMTYNRSLKLMEPSIFDPTKLAGVDLGKIWLAGALGGLACWVVSAPSELVKCRTQLVVDGQGSSYATFVDVYKRSGLRGLYLGGAITSLRDSIGYGWYFWSYELTKRLLLSRQPDPYLQPSASDVLMSGGIAGVITWASVFPLDVVKTRLQTQSVTDPEARALLRHTAAEPAKPSAMAVARDIGRSEGILGFYRGLGICSIRAFVVNAAQVSLPPLLCLVLLSLAVVYVRENYGLVLSQKRIRMHQAHLMSQPMVDLVTSHSRIGVGPFAPNRNLSPVELTFQDVSKFRVQEAILPSPCPVLE